MKGADSAGGPGRVDPDVGRQRSVRMGASAMFVSSFESGWRDTAAGCRPLGDQRYDCVIGG